MSDDGRDNDSQSGDRAEGGRSDREPRKPRRRTRVPTSRAERLARIGWLAGEFALGGAAEGVKRLVGAAAGEDSVFSSPAAAERLARRLARMRGAAMKVGQMLSLLDEETLPREFAQALAILRDAADTMPESQVRKMLVEEYGRDWEKHFAHFDFEPIASASIGQVHGATLQDGRELALKIQFPGVAESIESDVDNLTTALRVARVLPVDLDIEGLVAEIKRQLAQEADYVSESQYLLRYRELLADDARFRVPALIAELTTPRILAMERLFGVPIEDLAGPEHAQAQRDQAGSTLFELLFREIFEFELIQTDPNFSNYLLLAEDEPMLGLLDFGSSKDLPHEVAEQYRELFLALRNRERARAIAALEAIGFLEPSDAPRMRDRLVDLFFALFAPLSHEGPFDFATGGIIGNAQAMAMDLVFKQGFRRTAPARTVFLHRKINGMLMLCSRIKARVDVNAIFERVVERGSEGAE